MFTRGFVIIPFYCMHAVSCACMQCPLVAEDVVDEVVPSVTVYL